jgi:hypothetical protein
MSNEKSNYRIASISLIYKGAFQEYSFLDTIPPFVLTFHTPKLRKGVLKGDVTLTADTIDKNSGYYCDAQKSIVYAIDNESDNFQMYWNTWRSNQFLHTPPYIAILSKSLNIKYGNITYDEDSLMLYNYDEQKVKLLSVVKAVKL